MEKSSAIAPRPDLLPRSGSEAFAAPPADGDAGWRDGVRDAIRRCLAETSLGLIADDLLRIVASGKMLRATIAHRLEPVAGLSRPYLLSLSASVEMLHAASLVHDDVIDGARLRRGAPAFWTRSGTSGALLLGDLLMCRAMYLAATWADGDLTRILIGLLGDVCDGEAEQELILKGKALTLPQCLDIARRKTGSLFAYIGAACGGTNRPLRDALLEAGNLAGTAYQLADDIYDAYGDPDTSGKPLRSDSSVGKMTIGTLWRSLNVDPPAEIEALCVRSSECLADWPEFRQAWDGFLDTDLRPVLATFLRDFPGSERPAPE